MNYVSVPKDFQHLSPAGAEVRPLMSNSQGGIAHCTLPVGKISKVVAHRTVSEFWYVISGTGQIWRKCGKEEQTTSLEPGITIDIPLGIDFQYRCIGKNDLVFICVTIPPWPGADEVVYRERGGWTPTSLTETT